MKPTNIEELKPWYLVNADLILPYSNYIVQQYPGVAIIKNNVSLACMTMIYPATGWVIITKVLRYDLDKVMSGNYE